MPDWIEDASNRLKAEKERRLKDAEYQTAQQSAVHANIPTSLEKLIRAVEKDIALFNSHFPEPRKRLTVERTGETGFQVVRQYEPPFCLRVSTEEHILKYAIQRPAEASGEGRSIEGRFSIALDAKGGIRIFHGEDLITFEEASKAMIAPAIEYLRD